MEVPQPQSPFNSSAFASLLLPPAAPSFSFRSFPSLPTSFHFSSPVCFSLSPHSPSVSPSCQLSSTQTKNPSQVNQAISCSRESSGSGGVRGGGEGFSSLCPNRQFPKRNNVGDRDPEPVPPFVFMSEHNLHSAVQGLCSA